MFSDNKELVSELTVSAGLGSSDHNMVRFNIYSVARPKANLHRVPNFNQADFSKLRRELAQTDSRFGCM